MPLLDPIPSPVEYADIAALEWEPLLALSLRLRRIPRRPRAILALRPPPTSHGSLASTSSPPNCASCSNEQVSIPLGGLFDPTQLAAKAQIPGAALEAAELQAIARLANDVAAWQAFCVNRPRASPETPRPLRTLRRARQSCVRSPNPSSARSSPTAPSPTTPRPNSAASAANRSASSAPSKRACAPRSAALQRRRARRKTSSPSAATASSSPSKRVQAPRLRRHSRRQLFRPNRLRRAPRNHRAEQRTRPPPRRRAGRDPSHLRRHDPRRSRASTPALVDRRPRACASRRTAARARFARDYDCVAPLCDQPRIA